MGIWLKMVRLLIEHLNVRVSIASNVALKIDNICIFVLFVTHVYVKKVVER